MNERLYELLPAFLRYRDWYEGEPLRALMAVLETQFEALEEDIGKLQDDWFIETCEDRIAPYLGDLVGVRGLRRPEAWVPTQRARIANTLLYRQHKGTTAVLARAARDVTGWPCRAVPFYQLLSTSQSLGHLRPGRGGTVDVRDRAGLERLGGPFDECAHRPQISGGTRPAGGGPREGYNLSRLGLFFWRLGSYPVRGRTARRVMPGCYTFHPLGVDQPLFSRLRAPEPLTGGVGDQEVREQDVPGPIHRQALADELEARRSGQTPRTDYLGAPAAFEILDPATREPVPWTAIEAADLGQWHRPAARRVAPAGTEEIRLAVDPELGRLAFADGAIPSGEVRVSCSYGFGGDLGGGPYLRPETELPEATVGAAETPEPGRAEGGRTEEEFSSLLEAKEARPSDAGVSVIRITDSVTYGGAAEVDLVLDLRPGDHLVLEAEPGTSPCFVGDLKVRVAQDDGERSRRKAEVSRLTLAGLMVGGKIELEGPVQIDLRHCTVRRPAGGSPSGRKPESCVEMIGEASSAVTVRIDSSLVGPLWLPAGIGSLEITDSVVDGGAGLAIAEGASGSAGPATAIVRSTLFGGVSVSRLTRCEDVLFTAPVAVKRRHEGVVRHSYLPHGSSTPRRELCQPDLALEEAADEVAVAEVLARLVPAFTSRIYGQPGYAQLSGRCPPEIRAGGSGGSEMGVFQSAKNAFREANLPGILEEYLPWGLEPRIFYVT